jgi:hypothetical protein
MEARLFEAGTVPECTTSAWYADREAAPHLEQPGHRERLLQAGLFVKFLADTEGVATVVDLGAGDGGLLSVLATDRRLECWGYDLCPANVEAAKARGVNVGRLDVVAQEPRWADVAVATEMLEHLLDPHGFLSRVREYCRFLVASSPWNETATDHYEFHTWAWDMAGYRDLLSGSGWKPIYQEPVGRFQVVVAARDYAVGGIVQPGVYMVGESGPEQVGAL